LKSINNVPSYFWNIISSSGFYPEPKGYISAEQRQVMEAKRALKAMEKETAALEKALQEKREKVLRTTFLKHFGDTWS
jgi:hypothetical protein